jgi:hypothetical protein
LSFWDEVWHTICTTRLDWQEFKDADVHSVLLVYAHIKNKEYLESYNQNPPTDKDGKNLLPPKPPYIISF